MILLINRVLILLLLVLQGLAPLVHAHVHIINSDEGVHIHVITTVRSHEHPLSALENISCTNTAIGMQSAISKKKELNTDMNSGADYYPYFDVDLSCFQLEKSSDFWAPDILLYSSRLIADSVARGPPL